MEAGNYYLVVSEIEGWKLTTPISYVEATPEEIAEHTGGCGPGKFGDWFVPDTILGESIFLACQIHDWMYYKGINLEDKDIADRTFLNNMVVLINDGELLDNIRLRTVMTYFQAVSVAGGDAFDKGVGTALVKS